MDARHVQVNNVICSDRNIQKSNTSYNVTEMVTYVTLLCHCSRAI